MIILWTVLCGYFVLLALFSAIRDDRETAKGQLYIAAVFLGLALGWLLLRRD